MNNLRKILPTSDGLLWLAFLCLILGARLLVCNHYAGDIPSLDEWNIGEHLREMRDRSIRVGELFQVHVQHIIFFTRLEEYFTVKLNGLWQLRVGNVFHSIIYSAFALAGTLAVRKAAGPNRWVCLFGGLITFAVPWAGDRTLWSLLSCFTWMMFWTVLLCVVLSRMGSIEKRGLRLVGSVSLCALAFISMGSGAVASLLATAWCGFLFLKIPGKQMRRFLGAAALVHFIVFVIFFLLIPREKGGGSVMASDIPTTTKAFLRCLAYPLVNVWAAGLVAFCPWGVLLVKKLVSREAPSKGDGLLLLLGGAVVLQSLAIAFFRGDNNNGGVPASRYYDLLLLGPLVNFGILIRLLSEAGLGSRSRPVLASAWTLVTAGGFLLVLFWRVLPWLSLASGEWEQGLKQATIASWCRGEVPAIPSYSDPSAPEISWVGDQMKIGPGMISLTNEPGALISGAMIAGHSLAPAEGSGGFSVNGYPDNRFPRPWLRYWGSYDRSGAPDYSRKFVSAPFQVNSTHLQFDFLFDKKSRFRFYNLGACSLKLVKMEDGQEIDVLRAIPRFFPSILMDRETVCLKVPEAGLYRIEARDDELGSGWFAFSEPSACGPLGVWAQIVLNSGKLLLAAGAFLVALLASVEAFSRGQKRPPILISDIA